MSDITQLKSGDLSTIWRAAKRLDREALSWREGWCVCENGEWVFPQPATDQLQADIEVRVMGLENSARMLRDIAKKLSRKADLPFNTESDEPAKEGRQ
jgi:hypothetical protein